MRLIDADALLKHEVESDRLRGVFLVVPKGFILDAPTVEAEPVVHARWVFADDQYCRCTRCNQKAPVILQYQDEPETVATDYCPNCGAKMQIEKEEQS